MYQIVLAESYSNKHKSDKGYHGKKYLITIPMYDDRRWNSSSYLRNVFKYIDIL